MKQRIFGKGGPQVGEVGMGCWQLGGSDWGNVSEASALEILTTAAEGGTTFFDTADVYERFETARAGFTPKTDGFLHGERGRVHSRPILSRSLLPCPSAKG